MPQVSNQDFEYALRYAALGMCLVSLEGKYLKVNETFTNFLGYNEKELLGKHFKDVTYKDDIKISIDNHQNAINDKFKTYQCEKRFLHKNGDTLWAIASTVLVRDENYNPLYFFSQVQDLTHLKNTNVDLKHLTELQQLKHDVDNILSKSHIAQAMISLDGDYFKVNKAMPNMFGYSEEEFLKMNYKDITYEEDIKLSENKDKEAIENKISSNQYEKRYYHKNGDIIYGLLDNILIKDEHGNPLYFFTQIQDISARKKYEREIKDVQERYELVIRASQDGIWDTLDRKKDEEYWSDQYKRLLGYMPHEIKGSAKLFYNSLHPDDLERTKKAIEAHNKNRNIPYSMEYRIKTKSGQYRWYSTKGIITTKNGIDRITGSLSDIHEYKQAEEALELNKKKLLEYTKELERINEDLDSFAYIASHDLKEPVRNIVTNICLLQEDHKNILDANANKRLEKIIALCDKMEQIINSLLEFAKLKNKDLKIKRIDLNEIIQSIISTYELSSEKVSFKLLSPLPKTICDEVTITEVFRNLISNAIKYNNRKNKIVEISYTTTIGNNGIPKNVFYVKDNGIGIQEKHKKDIFQLFKRLDDTNEKIEGTGIGLTFVKKIIDRHGGKIWVESDPGEGSTFYFTVC